MPTRSSIAAAGCVVAAALLSAPALTGQKAAPAPASAAFRVIELPSGRTLSAGREDLLGTPVLPGSIIKVATLVAALESGVIGPDTRMVCPREVVIDGRRVSCSHPDLRRPIGPAEALAHSCNGYFAAVAGRLRREALDRALVQLGLPRDAAVGAAGERRRWHRWRANSRRPAAERVRAADDRDAGVRRGDAARGVRRTARRCRVRDGERVPRTRHQRAGQDGNGRDAGRRLRRAAGRGDAGGGSDEGRRGDGPRRRRLRRGEDRRRPAGALPTASSASGW